MQQLAQRSLRQLILSQRRRRKSYWFVKVPCILHYDWVWYTLFYSGDIYMYVDICDVFVDIYIYDT